VAANEAVSESEHLKSLIISTTQALWEDKDALGKFLDVVRRSEACVKLADTPAQSEVRGSVRSETVQTRLWLRS
jgi:hypothetical protein